jgi:hypothetical protein
LSQFDPFTGDFKPRLFVERAYCLLCLLAGVLSLLAVSGGIFVGHCIDVADLPILLKAAN